MKLLKVIIGLTVISLFASCSDIFSTRDESVTISFDENTFGPCVNTMRAVLADQGSNLYATLIISGDVNKRESTPLSFNKMKNFSLTCSNLPLGSKVNVEIQIDDELTKDLDDYALFAGRTDNIILKDKKVPVTVNLKTTQMVYSDKTVGCALLYIIDENNEIINLMHKKNIDESLTNDENNLLNEIVTNSMGNIEDEYYYDSSSSIWYTGNLDAVFKRIALIKGTFDIESKDGTCMPPAAWPRVFLANDIELNKTIDMNNYVSTTGNTSIAAHIYLNSKTISTSEETYNMFNTTKDNFLYFYNGKLDTSNAVEGAFVTVATESNSTNLLFSNIEVIAPDNESPFLTQEHGITIFTGNSKIRGKISGTGEIVLAGASVDGNITIDNGDIDMTDKFTHGDYIYTSRNITNKITENVDLIYNTGYSAIHIDRNCTINGVIDVGIVDIPGSTDKQSNSIGFTAMPTSKIKVKFSLLENSQTTSQYCFKTCESDIYAKDTKHGPFLTNADIIKAATTWIEPQIKGNYSAVYKTDSNSNTTYVKYN